MQDNTHRMKLQDQTNKQQDENRVCTVYWTSGFEPVHGNLFKDTIEWEGGLLTQLWC